MGWVCRPRNCHRVHCRAELNGVFGFGNPEEIDVRLPPATGLLVVGPSENLLSRQGVSVAFGSREQRTVVRVEIDRRFRDQIESTVVDTYLDIAAIPGRLSGRLSTTAQSGVSKVAGLAMSCVPTVHSPRPASQSVSEMLLRSPCPAQSPGGSGSRTFGPANALRRPRSDDSAQSMLPIVKNAHRQMQLIGCARVIPLRRVPHTKPQLRARPVGWPQRLQRRRLVERRSISHCCNQ